MCSRVYFIVRSGSCSECESEQAFTPAVGLALGVEMQQYKSADQFDRAYRSSREAMRVRVRDWLVAVCKIMDASPHEVSQKAGVSPQTLSRIIYHQTAPSIPSLRTLRKVSRVSGVPIAKGILDPVGPYALRAFESGAKRKEDQARSERVDALPLFAKRRENRALGQA